MVSERRWPTYNTRETTLVSAADEDPRGSLRVRDADGNVYLDAVGGIGCAPLGHAHPAWVDAIHQQLKTLASASNSFRTTPQQQLADRLTALFPVQGGDGLAFICTTGAESTEASIKVALRATGRDTIVAFERAFHGRTLASIGLSANPKYREPYVSTIDDHHDDRFADLKVLRLPFNDEAALEQAFADHGSRIATVFFEPVQGEGGIWPGTKSFLLKVRELCDRHGALVGVDEVQSGTGRTGNWLGWTSIVGDEAQPDIIWVAKALGGGYPVAAAIARRDLADHMQPGSHGTTYGGNPVACAAALATLRIIEEEGLLASAREQLPTLRAIAQAEPIAEVTEIRGLGAMIGIQVGALDGGRAVRVGEAMMDRGVLVTTPGGHTVRVLLPYRAGRAELEILWRTLAEAVAATAE